ncbi:MAG: hypothetical protein NMNS01_04070 [Nitrosomonas sp.]|nr:MAG: hypothetical protein NMNS01_04070 [Nitrosomonas sp.]
MWIFPLMLEWSKHLCVETAKPLTLQFVREYRTELERLARYKKWRMKCRDEGGISTH